MTTGWPITFNLGLEYSSGGFTIYSYRDSTQTLKPHSILCQQPEDNSNGLLEVLGPSYKTNIMACLYGCWFLYSDRLDILQLVDIRLSRRH